MRYLKVPTMMLFRGIALHIKLSELKLGIYLSFDNRGGSEAARVTSGTLREEDCVLP